MADYEMTPQRWEQTKGYMREVFAREDDHQHTLMQRAVAAGIPEIDVGPENGRFLQMLAMMKRARLIIEVGTLAGSSAIWLARGLAPGGHLLPLIKPQFEAGREAVGKGGIVRDEETRVRVVAECAAALAGLGLTHLGTCDSGLPGASGNREAFALYRKGEA